MTGSHDNTQQPWQRHGSRGSCHQTFDASIPHTTHTQSHHPPPTTHTSLARSWNQVFMSPNIGRCCGIGCQHPSHLTPHIQSHNTHHTPHSTHILPRQRHGTRVSCRNQVSTPYNTHTTHNTHIQHTPHTYNTHHTHITLARSRNQVFMSPNIGRCCGIGCQQPSIILTSSFGILGVMGGRSLRTCICIYIFTRIYKYSSMCIYGISGVMGGGSLRKCIFIACMCMYIHAYTYIYTYTYR